MADTGVQDASSLGASVPTCVGRGGSGSGLGQGKGDTGLWVRVECAAGASAWGRRGRERGGQRWDGGLHEHRTSDIAVGCCGVGWGKVHGTRDGAQEWQEAAAKCFLVRGGLVCQDYGNTDARGRPPVLPTCRVTAALFLRPTCAHSSLSVAAAPEPVPGGAQSWCLSNGNATCCVKKATRSVPCPLACRPLAVAGWLVAGNWSPTRALPPARMLQQSHLQSQQVPTTQSHAHPCPPHCRAHASTPTDCPRWQAHSQCNSLTWPVGPRGRLRAALLLLLLLLVRLPQRQHLLVRPVHQERDKLLRVLLLLHVRVGPAPLGQHLDWREGRAVCRRQKTRVHSGPGARTAATPAHMPADNPCQAE